ncbi:MAG: hypothetical protein J0M18_06655 [Ignavibacteria bacterium]|nr:hypothetical protein [Ignavibacteria bacterium]
MLPEIFRTKEKFIKIYDDYLLNLLQKKISFNDLGVLILLSAQAAFNKDLYKKTFTRLNSIYKKLSKEINGIPDNLKNDDYFIALKILEIGWKNIEKVSFKKLNALWNAQYNHLRTFKPRRNALDKISSIYKKFDKKTFNFNKPFLRRERFKKCQCNGMNVSCFYNKFPFVPYHTLLVPEQEKNHPQFLRRRFHYYACDLIKAAGGFAIGYNSIGAFASVNHLHFQLFVKNKPLAVENEMWKHSGGRKEYPAKCFVFESKRASWDFIKMLHQNNIPYNILYTKEKIYIFPMNFQKSHKNTIFPLGFAWIELAGSFINVTKKDYDNLTEKKIVREFNMNKFTKKLTLK